MRLLLFTSIIITICSCNVQKTDRQISQTEQKIKKEIEAALEKTQAAAQQKTQKELKYLKKRAKDGELTNEQFIDELNDLLDATKEDTNPKSDSSDGRQSTANPDSLVLVNGDSLVAVDSVLVVSTDSISADQPATTVTDSDDQKKKLDLSNFTFQELVDALDTVKLSKYTLDPDSVFFGFSTGANFEFVDGLDDASLFVDITGNLGQILTERLTGEVGVLSGRFSPTENESKNQLTRTLAIEQVSDNESLITSLEYIGKISSKTEKKFTRAFAQLNFRITPEESIHQNSKLYLSFQTNYNRIQFDATTISLAESEPDTTQRAIDQGLSDREFEVNLIDTVDSRIVQDRISFLLGTKLFKGTPNFDFTIGVYLGYTHINEIRREFNSSGGNRISSINNPLIATINSESKASYLIQAAILEKKVIGAKIGFELSNRFGISNEAPEYYFFVSKQFSMQEFFRLFSPTASSAK